MGPIVGSYLFAAIIIGYIDSCNVGDEYNFINPNLYLKIGGFGFLALCIVTTCTRFTICESKDYENYEGTTKGQAAILSVAILLQSIWAIIGCIVYSKLSAECQGSSIGNMILSFIIITFIFNACNSISLIQGCFEDPPGDYTPLRAV